MKNSKRAVFAKFKNNARRKFETRALPSLIEQRNNLLTEMKGIVEGAEAETRALNDDESKRFDEIKSEIRAIDKTLSAQAEKRALEEKKEVKTNDKEAEKRALEEKNFVAFIRGNTEERALDVGNNGGVIPESIADKIVERVKELSPIYKMVSIYNVGGDLVFPVYDDSTDTGASIVGDMQKVEESSGKFTTIKLENYIVGVLKLVSKSLINRSDFDLLNFVVNKVAEDIVVFLEKTLINGSADKTKYTYEGIFETKNLITVAAENAITIDELIDVQMTVPQAYQQNAVWIMHKNTLKSLRKLKDADNNYILNRDITNPFGWTLLGKSVFTSENAPEMASDTTAVVYGDMSGLYVKLTKNMEINVLREKYADQYAYGVIGYTEFDSKIVEAQKLAGLKMKKAATKAS